jgi:hypothetical protein
MKTPPLFPASGFSLQVRFMPVGARAVASVKVCPVRACRASDPAARETDRACHDPDRPVRDAFRILRTLFPVMRENVPVARASVPVNDESLITPATQEESMKKMGIIMDRVMNAGGFAQPQREFLEFHRTNVFLKWEVNA